MPDQVRHDVGESLIMHPYRHAQATPDKPAIIVAETGRAISYKQLDDRSNQAAQLFRVEGLQVGDKVAIFLENTPDYFPLVWGAQRSGLHFVAISSKLTAPEVDYILEDSGAKLLVAGASLGKVAETLNAPAKRFSHGGAIAGFAAVEAALDAQPVTRIADETAGSAMLYSSGTTGRPKGIVRPPSPDPAIDHVVPLAMIANLVFGLGPESVYLSTAPLYHAAPLGWTMTVQILGGTVVLMQHFDPEAALANIERYRCNAGQFVPTHFVRMLKLPDEVRTRYDLSSMKTAIHAAAPCPVPVKRGMIDWWGPVIDEYYAGTEGNGFTAIKAAEWLDRPGSVGRAVGEAKLHVCDEEGNQLPPRAEGLVFFEAERQFEYHNAPEKTADSRNKHGWSTLGDVGWVDEEGFLYLTDRKSFMIISGGVNIYPQEIENHLVTHPSVADVAVVGAPHEEMGEQVVAVIQPMPGVEPGEALAEELAAFCRRSLSGVKTPRRFDFVDELPRHATGKLYKRLIRDRYWGKVGGIV
jgi:acyl-CoA synthetase (AMP-forming)/AMP-acid ligase II